MNKTDAPEETITIILPVFNDWASFQRLVKEIDEHIDEVNTSVTVIAVDDGSTQTPPSSDEISQRFRSVKRIEILHLARNMGHQRAIAIGLSYTEHTFKSDIVLVMDADGEDNPATIPDLLREVRKSNQIVFARRGNRQQNAVFLAFYHIYRSMFFILTGEKITFGNYCAIPGKLLRRVVFLSEIWNHFAAGILRSGLPQTTLALPRGVRYSGNSKMSFVGLVLHGLSAISIYTDILAVRLILFSLGIIVSTIVGSIIMLYIRFFTELAIPGWATSVAFGLGIILFQALIFLSVVSFLVLSSRSAEMFIPGKHYEDFLLKKEIIYGQP
jgi:polyisoprenyl-phosphate glycosyltransferase